MQQHIKHSSIQVSYLYYLLHFVAEDSLRITSNVPGDIIEENDIIEYTCDVRYAGNFIPAMKWTTASSPDRILPHTKKNSDGIARSVIKITGNKKVNGQRFICTLYFEDPLLNKDDMATNAPDCTLQVESIPLTVHRKYFALTTKT